MFGLRLERAAIQVHSELAGEGTPPLDEPQLCRLHPLDELLTREYGAAEDYILLLLDMVKISTSMGTSPTMAEAGTAVRGVGIRQYQCHEHTLHLSVRDVARWLLRLRGRTIGRHRIGDQVSGFQRK